MPLNPLNATKKRQNVSIGVELLLPVRRRRFALACILVWLAAPGAAAEPECASIADDAERLACYDAKYGVTPAAEREPAVAAERAAAPDATTRRKVAAPAQDVVSEEGVREPAPSVDERDATAGASTPNDAGGDQGVAARPEGRTPTIEETAVVADAVTHPTPDATARPAATGVVANIRERWPDARRVFTLADGRRWVQTRAQRVAIDVGDRVTLKARRFGQHLMVGPNGATTRVQRLGSEPKRE